MNASAMNSMAEHPYYWDGLAVGLFVGIVLGWMVWRLPVHARRYMIRKTRRDLEDIRRIEAGLAAPLRTIEEIASDPPKKTTTHPRHLRVEETEWSRFRDDPKAWMRALVPELELRTPERVALQAYQEIIWHETRPPMRSDTATSMASSFGPIERPPAPWLGTTMKLARAFTDAASTPSSSTLVGSGLR